MVLILLVLAAVLLAIFSSRLRKPALIAAASISIGTYLWYSVIPVDEFKYWAFDKYCESANEKVLNQKITENIAIEYRPWSGVMEDSYYPTWLTRELLKEPRYISTIQLVYDVPRDKVVSESCTGKYVITTQEPDTINVPACGKMIPSSAVKLAPVSIYYEYQKENFLSIRPFRFIIKNTESGAVLAEQHSYQLLLGNMHKRENMRWYGWGSAQGAKVCKLTSPKDFILRVVGPSS